MLRLGLMLSMLDKCYLYLHFEYLNVITIVYSIMNPRAALPTLLLTFLLFNLSICELPLSNMCKNPEVHRYLVVSEAKI
jgi:hypothetical protein